MGAAPADGAQGGRARGADRRARSVALVEGVRRAREGGARAGRGRDRGARRRAGVCRGVEAFRPRGLRRALPGGGVLRRGRPHDRRAGRAARARDAKPLAALSRQVTQRSYRYYEFVMAAFVTILICSNLIGPAKIAQLELPLVGAVSFGAGVLFFPISYVFGDVLTEVYGYARARRVIWAGFAGLAFAALMAAIAVARPPAPFWKHQDAYEVAFGTTWRIAAASMSAYFCGEFANSFVLAKMKIATAGRWLWTCTIGSTLVGEAVDSALFYPLAFYGTGILPDDKLPAVMLAQFVGKVAGEVGFTPLTYQIGRFLKRAEQEDYYDRGTDFNPFVLKD